MTDCRCSKMLGVLGPYVELLTVQLAIQGSGCQATRQGTCLNCSKYSHAERERLVGDYLSQLQLYEWL